MFFKQLRGLVYRHRKGKNIVQSEKNLGNVSIIYSILYFLWSLFSMMILHPELELVYGLIIWKMENVDKRLFEHP